MSRTPRFAPALAACALLPVAAQADSLPGIATDAVVSYTVASFDGDVETFFYADGTAGIDLGAGFGADLVFAYIYDVSEGDAFAERLDLVLRYSGTFGTLSFGEPDTALTVASDAVEATGFVSIAEFESAYFTGSPLGIINVDENGHVFGLRYDGTFGGFDLSASIHRIEGEDDLVLSFGGSYGMNDAFGYFAVEFISGLPADTVPMAVLGGGMSFDALTVSAELGTGLGYEAGLGSFLIDLSYALTDEITLGASRLAVYENGNEAFSLTGIAAEYATPQGFFGSLGAARNVGQGDATIWAFEAGYRF